MIRLVSPGRLRLNAHVATAPATYQLIVIMGVAGSGKTTIGRALAAALGWDYFEADDFHPPENVTKMSRGIALTDADREPWLRRIRERMEACGAARRSAVFTCSALKSAYRRMLSGGLANVRIVYLQADPAVVTERMSARRGHYMKAEMVRSQFAALEPPMEALTIDARQPPAAIVAQICAAIGEPFRLG